MIKGSITIEDAIELLNQARELDSDAMHNLIVNRVPCNEELQNHPSIQVGRSGVGLLGIINGLFGATGDGWGAIAATYEVKCEKGCESKENDNINKPCAECGGKLSMGNLQNFCKARE